LDKLKNRKDLGYKARESIRIIERETSKKDSSVVLTGEYADDPILDFDAYGKVDKLSLLALILRFAGGRVGNGGMPGR